MSHLVFRRLRLNRYTVPGFLRLNRYTVPGFLSPDFPDFLTSSRKDFNPKLAVDILQTNRNLSRFDPLRYSDGGVYSNYMDDDETTRLEKVYGENLPRLQVLRDTYDPDNIFHLNQNIRPSK